MGPHSLGQSVEWKLGLPSFAVVVSWSLGPTRWGNQLNGNFAPSDITWGDAQSIGPTRWGNQLNGNSVISPPHRSTREAPLAGAIS